MDRVILVANLKSNQTKSEAKLWLEILKSATDLGGKEIIICPPFTLLDFYSSYIKENSLFFKLGAQNVSSFPGGAYTGEVNAEQIKEFADYVLIGHSERRRLLKETDDMVLEKVEQSLANNLIPLYFLQTTDMMIPGGVQFVVYEPPGSISGVSGGVPDNIEDVVKAIEVISSKGDYKTLYGGSVNSANIKDFSSKSNISGLVIGAASLDAQEFIQVIKNA